MTIHTKTANSASICFPYMVILGRPLVYCQSFYLYARRGLKVSALKYKCYKPIPDFNKIALKTNTAFHVYAHCVIIQTNFESNFVIEHATTLTQVNMLLLEIVTL